jgi:Leucine-rich repeat (LRR) protein
MAGISLILQNNPTVTQINCGVSSPKLGGTIDLSAFPNIQEFRCEQNDITNISGYNSNTLNTFQIQTNLLSGSFPNLTGLNNLVTFWIYNNSYSGSFPTGLANLTNLQNFRCEANRLTGSIPSLSNFPLRYFSCHNQTGTTKLTGPIPALTGCPLLIEFECHTNHLGGSLPVLSGLNSLQVFNCFTQTVNGITGTIPVLNNPSLRNFRIENNLISGIIPSLNNIRNIELFSCFQNRLTGSIPSLSQLTGLRIFWCYNQVATTKLTDFAGGSVSNTLGEFRADSNQLSSTAVNSILAAFVAAGRTTGNATGITSGFATCTLNLGGASTTNFRPTGQGVTDVTTLRDRGWIVTTGTRV